MLPILRILPVGGVLLAITILLLALVPPSGMTTPSAPRVVAARGALIDRDDHPEWRQFLIQAALRRAGELERLRDLPEVPMIRIEPEPLAPPDAAKEDIEPPPPPIAGLPATRIDADPDPDDVTGSIVGAPGATLQIDIGETSSTELPVAPVEEKPPVIMTPERAKPPGESRRRPPRQRRAKPAIRPQPAAEFNLLELLFGKRADPQPGAASRASAY